MLFTDFDPARDPDHGQIHIRLVHSTVEEMGDPRRGQQVGYWCDLAHLEQVLKALARVREQAYDHISRRAEREALAARTAEIAADVRRDIAAQLKKKAELLKHSSPGCDCGCKYAARVLEFEAREVLTHGDADEQEACDAPPF